MALPKFPSPSATTSINEVGTGAKNIAGVRVSTDQVNDFAGEITGQGLTIKDLRIIGSEAESNPDYMALITKAPAAEVIAVGPVPNAKYVTKSGNDGTADGSLAKPYATIQAAINACSDTEPESIVIYPGVYDESPAWTNKHLTIYTLGFVSIGSSYTAGLNAMQWTIASGFAGPNIPTLEILTLGVGRQGLGQVASGFRCAEIGVVGAVGDEPNALLVLNGVSSSASVNAAGFSPTPGNYLFVYASQTELDGIAGSNNYVGKLRDVTLGSLLQCQILEDCMEVTFPSTVVISDTHIGVAQNCRFAAGGSTVDAANGFRVDEVSNAYFKVASSMANGAKVIVDDPVA